MARLAMMTVLLLPVQQTPQARELWDEWLVIPTSPRDSWAKHPFVDDELAGPAVPLPLDRDHPILGGRLVLRRGGTIEAWDLDAKTRLWKLPSSTGTFGWSLADRKVGSVLPGGPAGRARLTTGDRIVSCRRVRASLDSLDSARAGDTFRLGVRSAGGERETTITATGVPEPHGRVPTFVSLLDDDVLIRRDGRVERLRLRDGTILWSMEGYDATPAGSRVAIRGTRGLTAVDATSGAELWTATCGSSRWAQSVTPTDDGLLLCWSVRDSWVVELRGWDGSCRWSRRLSASAHAGAQVLAGRRVLRPRIRHGRHPAVRRPDVHHVRGP